jgi:hypothetical protein
MFFNKKVTGGQIQLVAKFFSFITGFLAFTGGTNLAL